MNRQYPRPLRLQPLPLYKYYTGYRQATAGEEDPFLTWAVDGQMSTFRPVYRTQHSAEEMTLLRENGNERGKNILACVFSRLIKAAAGSCPPPTYKSTIQLLYRGYSGEITQITRYIIFGNILVIF